MSDQESNQLPPEAEDPDVEAHLLKEALAAGAIAIGGGAIAGTAQAMPNQLPVPGAGGGSAQLPVPGGGSAQVPTPGAGGGSGQATDPGGGSGMAAKKHAPAKKAKPKSKVHKHQGSTHTTPPNKPPLQPEG